MIRIRRMTADDLPLGMRLKEQAGWNQTLADWQRFLAMQPEGCLVAELDGVAAGTTVVTALGAVAWISMVLVEESLRGQGVGKRLLTAALSFAEQLGCSSVRLDATPLGQPLYEKLGSVRQYELTRFAGVAAGASPAAATGIAMRGVTEEDLGSILELDRRTTNTQRGNFLRDLFRQSRATWRVAVENHKIIGYLAIRPGSEAIQLGPCIAESPAAGSALMVDALVRHAGSRVYWDLPASHSAACQLARSAGLSPQRQFVRMCRGELVNDDLEMLWASSGPELG